MRTAVMHALVGVVLVGLGADAQEARHDLPRRAAAAPPTAPASRPAPAARGRAGTMADAAPAPTAVAPPVYVGSPVYYVTDGYILTGAPYLALSDGSVLVNFGHGYERVLRPCVAPVNAVAADPWARDALGRIPDPPGIAAIKAGARGLMNGTLPTRSAAACYRVDAQGQVQVVAAGR